MTYTDKELRNVALQLALTQLQARFEHLTQAVLQGTPPEGVYLELVMEHYPTTEDIISEADKYIAFINKVE